MDFKIRTNISKEYKDAEIIINAAELNEDIQLLIKWVKKKMLYKL